MADVVRVRVIEREDLLETSGDEMFVPSPALVSGKNDFDADTSVVDSTKLVEMLIEPYDLGSGVYDLVFTIDIVRKTRSFTETEDVTHTTTETAMVSPF